MLQYWSIRIALICITIFLLQLTILPLTDEMALVSADVLYRPWTIITSMFAHGGFPHLFYNMFALFLFGLILESIIGSKKLLLIYFSAGIAGSVASLPFYTATLGASGAIFGILGALAILRPRMIVYVSFVPMPIIVAVAVWAAIDLLGFLAPTGIANAAHLAGLAIGLLAGLYLKKEYGERPKPRRRPPHISELELRRWEEKYMV